MHDVNRQIPLIPSRHSTPLDDLLHDALLHDAGCAVAFLEPGGRICECNDAFAHILGETTSSTIEGKAIQSVFDQSALRTQHKAIQHVIDHDEPVVVETVLGDRFVRITFRPMHEDHTDSRRVLMVITPWDPDHPPPADAKLHHLLRADRDNPLSSLTPREREVLRHIGMGLPTAEIARLLHRSVKTIEGHRVSLGLKLGVSNRVQLARIAIRCGLSPLSAVAVEPKPDPVGQTPHRPDSRAPCASTDSGSRR